MIYLYINKLWTISLINGNAIFLQDNLHIYRFYYAKYSVAVLLNGSWVFSNTEGIETRYLCF